MSLENDPFRLHKLGLTAPAVDFELVTPDDDNELAQPTRYLSWGKDGDLVVLKLNGDQETIPAGTLAIGVLHPIRVRQVLSTGTVASDIVAWY